MTFVESIKTCIMQKYISVQGRASRSEYWWFVLFSYVANFISNFIPFIGIIISLALLIPSITVAVRRCHDLGKSGWLLLAPTVFLLLGCIILAIALGTGSNGMLTFAAGLLIIGALGGVALSIYFIFPGNQGANKYGEAPYVYVDNKANAQAV